MCETNLNWNEKSKTIFEFSTSKIYNNGKLHELIQTIIQQNNTITLVYELICHFKRVHVTKDWLVPPGINKSDNQ